MEHCGRRGGIIGLTSLQAGQVVDLVIMTEVWPARESVVLPSADVSVFRRVSVSPTLSDDLREAPDGCLSSRNTVVGLLPLAGQVVAVQRQPAPLLSMARLS